MSISTLSQHNHEITASDSGLIITNLRSFSTEIERIQRRRASDRHRFLLIVEVEPDSEDPTSLIHRSLETHFTTVSELCASGVPTAVDRADRISAVLGTECDAAVFDARAHFDPGLLAALANTIRAYGMLVILAPRVEHWPRLFADRDRSRFIERFRHALRRYQLDNAGLVEHRVVSLHEATRSSFAIGPTGSSCDAVDTALSSPARVSADSDATCPLPDARCLEDQERLLDTLLSSIRRRTAQVLIIEGARGRGKSALLGRLGARLTHRRIPWFLSSARRSALRSLERHWRSESSQLGIPVVSGSDDQASGLPWRPPDRIHVEPADDTNPHVLMVDEAADLPLQQLQQWAESGAIVVLATTTHGYEGSGRGFATRLSQRLDASGIAWRQYGLTRPIRFVEGDPLESFLNDVLLLEVNAQRSGKDLSTAELDQSRFTRLSQDELLVDEGRLRGVFGLLREAHYQTTPMDLVHLLDASELEVHGLIAADTIVAVTLSTFEGGIETVEHADILNGRRRLRDQLLPQLLARMVDEAEILSLRFRRIVRIAVAPELRRCGLGSRLLHELERHEHPEVVATGASYSQDGTTAAFWQSAGFQTFHEGFRRHPRSGQTTACVLRPRPTEPSVDETERRVDMAKVAATLAEAVGILEANRQAGRWSPSSEDMRPDRLSSRDRRLIRRFADGARSYQDTRAALLQLWQLDAKRATPASLHTLQQTVCSALPANASRKRQENALRQWARHTLTTS